MHAPAVSRPSCPAVFTRTYLANVHAPGFSRMLIRTSLGLWGLGHLTDTAELIVSELVTNAVRNAVGNDVELRIQNTAQHLIVRVWDDNPKPPALQPPDEESDNGRGLLIVAALSSDYGCYQHNSKGGKVVWAAIVK